MILYPLLSFPITCSIRSIDSYFHCDSLSEIDFPYPSPACSSSLRQFLYDKPVTISLQTSFISTSLKEDYISLSKTLLCRTHNEPTPFSEDELILFMNMYESEEYIIYIDCILMSMNQMKAYVKEWFLPFQKGYKRIGVCDLDKTLGICNYDISPHEMNHFKIDFSIKGHITYTGQPFVNAIQLRNDVHEFLHKANEYNMEIYVITAGDIYYAKQFILGANSKYWCSDREPYKGPVSISLKRIFSVRYSIYHYFSKTFHQIIPYFLLDVSAHQVPLWAVDDKIMAWNHSEQIHVVPIKELDLHDMNTKHLVKTLDNVK
jgi:hypothetical protein